MARSRCATSAENLKVANLWKQQHYCLLYSNSFFVRLPQGLRCQKLYIKIKMLAHYKVSRAGESSHPKRNIHHSLNLRHEARLSLKVAPKSQNSFETPPLVTVTQGEQWSNHQALLNRFEHTKEDFITPSGRANEL